MMRLACAAMLLWATGGAIAQGSAEPEGAPVPGDVLRDADFGVVTRLFGLERRVEMYQWRRAGAGYERVWNPGLIESDGFAPGHENPRAMPLATRRWWSQDATLDGRRLAPDVLRALGTWRDFRPGFSRLPANLAATFQPDGDGLSSSENPLDPQVGDLRVTWRELVLPPLAGRVELRDGVWRSREHRPVPTQDVPDAHASATGTTVASRLLPWALGLGALVLIGWSARRRGRR